MFSETKLAFFKHNCWRIKHIYKDIVNMSKQEWKTCKSENSAEIHLAAKKMHLNNKSNTKFVTDLLSFRDNWNESLDFIGNPIFSRNPENFWNWIELNWISLCKVSYVILELHNRSHVLNICLNNATRPKLIMTITIKKKNKYFKKKFEQNRRGNLYIATLCMTGKIFVYYEIVR